MTRLEISAPEGLPEIAEGSDLAAVIADATSLIDGDIVVVTSKIVSKAEGRVRTGSREDAVAEETLRVVARRGPTVIVRHRLGLTMAAAGVDASNVEPGSIVLLPLDPDASARALRERLRELTGADLGVVITDTAGRAWRDGQSDIAIGAAGLRVADDLSGRIDPYGNDLVVTRPAVADEIAGAADLVQGKLAGRPVAVVRGRADLVLPPGDDGPGADALIRPEDADLFGYGAREAVVRALAGVLADQAVFGPPGELSELSDALARVVGGRAAYASDLAPSSEDDRGVELMLPAGAQRSVVAALCFAHGWSLLAWDETSDPASDVAGPSGGSGVMARVSPRSP